MPIAPVIVSASASKVLGIYDHEIDLPVERGFTIVYGPNGVGKTKFLEIIDGLSRMDVRALLQLPFDEAVLRYSDGHELVARIVEDEPQTGDESTLARGVEFVLQGGKYDVAPWLSRGNPLETWLIQSSPWRPLANSDFWEDRRDGEVVPFSELASMYEDQAVGQDDAPEAYSAHVLAAPSFLIETQRLRINREPSRRRTVYRGVVRPRPASRIGEQSEVMRRLVNEAQTEHSKITQQLDRTFPNRVLERSGDEAESDEHVRDRYNDQNAFRSRLGRVASVALEDALSLPDRELSPFELNLLHLYLDDAERKLAPFEKLLQKIELLEDVVNSRLLNKHVQVTAGEGLNVRHDDDDRPIDLDSLSSGEQHEIILMFDLLFNVPEGALVLIDEPEISLHVVWQLAFIPDVERIADLAGFRFVVATHSPQIINDAWDSAVRLGPPEARWV